jgi:predicted kinase
MKLGSLIYEVGSNKRAIIFSGPAGSGKSTVVRNYIPPAFQEYVINPDKYLEPELKKIGHSSSDFSKFDSEQLSLAAKATAKSQARAKEDYKIALERGSPVILDITGGSSSVVKKKKSELEREGYAVMMIMAYAPPMETLRRNSGRDRSLLPSVVLRSWKDVTANIPVYLDMFGKDYFLAVSTLDRDSEAPLFDADAAEQYFKANTKYKELPPEEKALLTKEINRLEDSVASLEFTPFDELDTRIKSFLKLS